MRILLYDLETSPNLAYVWGRYEQDVLAYKDEWEILCFAYKWLDEKKVHTVRRGKDDKNVIEKLHKLFDEADVIIAHNGDRFDMRKVNARFMVYGFKPPSPYKTVDTLKVARKYFAFNSNHLTDLGKHLGLGEKASTGGFQLWLDCMNDDEKAWKKMLKYNVQDVKLLEQVYLTLRPYMTNHPNHNVVDETLMQCPTCGKGDLQKRGFRVTLVGKKQAYQCQDCGAWSQGRSIIHSTEIRP